MSDKEVINRLHYLIEFCKKLEAAHCVDGKITGRILEWLSTGGKNRVLNPEVCKHCTKENNFAWNIIHDFRVFEGKIFCMAVLGDINMQWIPDKCLYVTEHTVSKGVEDDITDE